MRLNKYVRNGAVQFDHDGPYRLTLLYGTSKYDPRLKQVSWATFDGVAIPAAASISPDQMGRPNEIVFHVAGTTYYPTQTGYVRLET